MGSSSADEAIAAFLSAVERGDPWRPAVREAASRLEPREVSALVRTLRTNRLVEVARECLAACDSPSLRALRDEVGREASAVREALRRRDEVLAASAEALSRARISYGVFKTLNGFEAPGVDVDVIVPPAEFDPAIRALRARGFRLIDAPDKRYATGLALGANPIVVDLHGDLAVLGIRYARPSLLLDGARERTYRSRALSREIVLRAAPPPGDALLRVAHAVIKEGAVSLLDVAEVLRLASGSRARLHATARGEGLDLALASFARIAGHAVASPLLASWAEVPEDGLSSLALGGAVPARTPRGFPRPVPLLVSLAALAYRLRAQEGLGRAAAAFGALRFRRNVEQLRSKVMHRFRGG